MKRLTLLILLCLSWLSGQAITLDSIDLESYLRQQDIQVQTIEAGLYCQFMEQGQGQLPQRGDYVMIDYVGKLIDGTVFDRSGAEPFVFQLGHRQVIRGWERGIPVFPVGSKGLLYVPPQLGFGKSGAGKVVPPNAALIYEIEVLKIMDYEQYDQYMMDLEEKERLAFEANKKKQFVEDKKRINEYAAAQKLKTKRLPSGVSYTLKKKGKGALPKDGDIISFHYKGYLLDGTLFDSSYKRKEPFSFEVGKKKTIKGLEEALRYFKKGNEGWILIPSQLAYGPMEIDEDGTFIPANAVLAFEVKVKNITRQ